jgi:hypothetical protein
MLSVRDILVSDNLLLGLGCLSVHKDRAAVADAVAALVVWEGTRVHRVVEAGRRSVLVEKTVEPDSSTRVRCSTVRSSRRSRRVLVTRKKTVVVVEQDLPTPGQRGSDRDDGHPRGDQRCFQRPRCGRLPPSPGLVPGENGGQKAASSGATIRCRSTERRRRREGRCGES